MGNVILADATTGISAILTQQIQGPSGALASPTGNGLVVVNNGAIQGAGLVGTSGQILLSGSSNVQWETMAGDATIVSGGTVTVGSIHGASVPIAGSLTTGNVLQVTGASALGYAPVNLAGGANYVTGLLPVASIAAGTNTYVLTTTGGVTVWAAPAAAGITALTQDVTATGPGSVAATVVQAQAGAITFASGTGLIGFAAADTGPGLSQPAAASSGIAPANITITSQAPNAGASTTSAGTPGSVVVALAAPVSTGVEAAWLVTRAGVNQAGFVASTLFGLTSASLHMTSAGFAPTTLNYVLSAEPVDGYVCVNGGIVGSTGALVLAYNGTGIARLDGGGITFFNSITAINAGGAGVIGVANAVTQPSSAPSGGIVLAANAGTFQVYDSAGNNVQLGGSGGIFSAATAIKTANASATNGLAFGITAGSTTLTAGAGGVASLVGGASSGSGATTGGNVQVTGGAATNGTGGNVNVSSGAGSTNGVVNLQSGSVNVVQVSASGILLSQPLGGVTGTPLDFKRSTGVALTSGASVNATTAQQATPYLALTGTLSGSGTIFNLNGITGYFLIDVSGVTFSSNTLTIKNGAGALPAFSTATGNLVIVYCPTTSTIVGVNA